MIDVRLSQGVNLPVVIDQILLNLRVRRPNFLELIYANADLLMRFNQLQCLFKLIDILFRQLGLSNPKVESCFIDKITADIHRNIETPSWNRIQFLENSVKLPAYHQVFWVHRYV